MSGAMVFLLCLVWIIGGCVTGEIASRQGRPFFTWFVAGMLCFVIAFLYLLLSKPSDEILAESGKYRKCPQCAEMVKMDAKVCRYCGSDLPAFIQDNSEEYENHITDEAIESGEKLLGNSESVIRVVIGIIVAFIVIGIIKSM